MPAFLISVKNDLGETKKTVVNNVKDAATAEMWYARLQWYDENYPQQNPRVSSGKIESVELVINPPRHPDLPDVGL